MKKKIKNSSFSSNLKSLYISSLSFFPNFLNLLSFFFKIIVTLVIPSQAHVTSSRLLLATKLQVNLVGYYTISAAFSPFI